MAWQGIEFAADWFGAARFDKERRGVKLADVRDHFARKKGGKPAATTSRARPNSHAPRPQQVGASTPRGSGGGFFDKDGDGDFDLSDVGAQLRADVEGPAREDMMRQNLPVFTVLQCILALGLWVTFAAKDHPDEFLQAKAGLDSLAAGMTDMAIHRDCFDLRVELYRWLTYQYTHANFSHVGLNVFLALLTGIPLEGFHGSLRVCLIFNLGVMGGACNFVLSDGHASLIGMSAGCYALMGMHLGDLIINWNETRYRTPKLAILLFLVAVDLLNVYLDSTSGESTTSHSAHIGGYSVGVGMGVIHGRNIVESRREKICAGILSVIGVAVMIFTVIWIAQWPPRTLWDTTPWCWVRQVFNESLFEEYAYHCVRCQKEDCVAEFSAMQNVEEVSFRICESTYGWSYSQQ